MARPKIKVDPLQVETLASIGCTNIEIAAVLACSVDTLNRRFADEITKGREKGKTKLRRLQWRSAEAGNVAMLIWLGKQLLGQRDKSDIELESSKGIPLNLSNEQLVELAKAARGDGGTK